MTQVYLNPVGGSDAASGTTTGAAWKTLGKVFNTINAGDVCDIINGGVLNEQVSIGRPLASMATVRVAAGQPAPELRGSLQFAGASQNWKVQGFKVNAFYSGVACCIEAHGQHLVIEGMELYGQDAEKMGVIVGWLGARANDVTVRSCIIHSLGATSTYNPGNKDHGVYLGVCDNALAEYNVIYDLKAGWGFHLDPDCHGAMVRNNTIARCGVPGGADWQGGSILLGTENAGTCINNTIQDNISESPNTGTHLYRFWGGAVGSNNVLSGNVIHGGQSTLVDPSASAGGTTESGTISGQNPLFVNPSANDFHLQASTPTAIKTKGAYPFAGGGAGGGGGGGAPPPSGAFVQAKAITADASATTMALTLDANVATGNGITVVFSSSGSTGDPTPTITDNHGNTYAPDRGDNNSVDSQFLWTYYAHNVTGGPTTITATLAASHTFRRLIAMESAGRDPALGIHRSAMAKSIVGSTATDGVTSGSVVTTIDGCQIISAVVDTSGAAVQTPGTGFTKRAEAGELAIEEKVQTTAGTVAGTWTFGTATHYIAAVIALAPSTVNPPTVITQSPASGAVGVGTGLSVDVSFSRAMDATTITSANFTLTGAGGSVAGTVVYDAATLTASFIPAFPLADLTSYSANLSTSIKALDGVALAGAVSWSFTTSSSQGFPVNVEVLPTEFVEGIPNIGLSRDDLGHLVRVVNSLQLSMGSSAFRKVAALSYGTTVDTNALSGDYFTLNVTNATAFTMSNPTNSVKGARIVYDIMNSSGGTMGAITWGSAFKIATGFTNPANTKRKTLQVAFDGTFWVQVGAVSPDI